MKVLKRFVALSSLACILSLSLVNPLVAADEMEAIVIELPEAFHGGTPLEYISPNLEPEDYRDYKPYKCPKGTAMVSKGKPVSSSFPEPMIGKLSQITDGDKSYKKTSVVELGTGQQWVQLDLEASLNIYAVLLWHFHEEKRVYFDFVVAVSDDPQFKAGVTTIYNNDIDNSSGLGVGKDKEYIETVKGRLIKTPEGVTGRYVRLYSTGNTHNEMNHYIEVEVFAKACEG